MSKRLFLAIRIPVNTAIREYLSEYQHQFAFAKMRWVDGDMLHLTLKFFGKVDALSIEKLQKSLKLALQKQEKFQISISKLSVFGSKNAPIVFWWGIEEEDFIKGLASSLQLEFDKLGLFADRQNFVPHITLARIIKTNSSNFFQKQLKRYTDLEPIIIPVSRIVLLESRPTNKNPEYIKVADYKLI
jgi:2'-5' RNA ligase